MTSPRREVGRASRTAASEMDSDLLAAELARSFCVGFPSGGPEARPADGALEPLELARHQGDVFRLALPVLESCAARPGTAPHALAFLDPGGWLLWVGGDRGVAARLGALDFRPGTRWLGSPGAPDPRAAADRRGLELVVPDRAASPAPWRCSSAPVVGRAGGGLLGTIHLTTRDVGELAGVAATADAIAERLHLALAIREQVVEFAMRTAAPADAMFAVDASGRVLASTPEGARLLAAQGGELPQCVRDELRCALDATPLAAAPEIVLRGRGSPATLLAAPVRCEQRAVGAIVRLAPGGGAAPAEPRTGGRPAARYAFEQILGASDAIGAAVALARTAARNELPVVLHGESGTGKELFAQAIHSASPRAGGPFVPMNCGCIPADLLEAELFGYEPGTFTGGRREGNAGKFEQAAKGTLFLDEVTELSGRAQTALLRVLQEREVVRLGGSSPRRIDVRIIAASSATLAEAVRAGRFRADLFYRLNVLPISVPPLRERGRDVALLARAFLRQAEAEVGRSGLSFSDEAIATLEAHPWPGNVRELRNIALRSAATAASPVIGREDLPREVRAAERPGRPEAADRAVAAAAPLAKGDAGAPDRDAILAVLQSCDWNVARTAQALRISRMTLYRWLHKLQIER
jgi:sigma-54 dependent transcriptional regulator, acetoin dehydrogenase operon transcriptional activator AcoR